MAAAAQSPASGKIGDLLFASSSFQVAILVRKANHRVGIADVDPFRIRSWGIKSDAKWLPQPAGKHLIALGLTVRGDAAQDFNYAGITLSDEQIAIRGRSDLTRIIETIGVQIDFESRGSLWPCVLRTRHKVGTIVYRLRRIRLRQIGHGDLVHGSSSFGLIVTESTWFIALGGHQRSRGKWDRDKKKIHTEADSGHSCSGTLRPSSQR